MSSVIKNTMKQVFIGQSAREGSADQHEIVCSSLFEHLKSCSAVFPHTYLLTGHPGGADTGMSLFSSLPGGRILFSGLWWAPNG